jgi:TolB-like protein
MTTMTRRPASLILLAVLVGCGGATQYRHPRADLGTVKTVGILPFVSMTGEPGVADKVQALFTIELLASNAFDVVEPGRVLKTMRDSRSGPVAELTPDEVKKLGKELNAQAVFVGTVLEFGESNAGVKAPQVTVQLKLVETGSGVTVWAATETRGGAKWDQRLFGTGGQSPVQAARSVLRSLIGKLLG